MERIRTFFVARMGRMRAFAALVAACVVTTAKYFLNIVLAVAAAGVLCMAIVLASVAIWGESEATTPVVDVERGPIAQNEPDWVRTDRGPVFVNQREIVLSHQSPQRVEITERIPVDEGTRIALVERSYDDGKPFSKEVAIKSLAADSRFVSGTQKAFLLWRKVGGHTTNILIVPYNDEGEVVVERDWSPRYLEYPNGRSFVYANSDGLLAEAKNQKGVSQIGINRDFPFLGMFEDHNRHLLLFQGKVSEGPRGYQWIEGKRYPSGYRYLYDTVWLLW